MQITTINSSSTDSAPRKAIAYRVKEAFYTLQGEGAQSGRPAVFCRFSRCNLWNGREQDRQAAICQFCDTDFIGEDGVNGGRFADADELAEHLLMLWPDDSEPAFIVCTGGEPLLQLDAPLIRALKRRQAIIAVETNGTLSAPEGIDWLCVSPKGRAHTVIQRCDELKFVFPQTDISPEQCLHIDADYYFISPMDEGDSGHQNPGENTSKALDYCLKHPKWRLSLQTHKILQIP